MNDFGIDRYNESSIFVIYDRRHEIELAPEYQRISGIWNLEKKQLLIDSLLNGFDVPKLYFHKFSPPKSVGDRQFRYAIIDGKQRLQAIWDFIDCKFTIADDFIYLRDDTLAARGLTYSQLAERYPRLRHLFDIRRLDIMIIDTDDLGIIEDLFSRLNEAAPLNAPEKRNAFGGPLPPLITEVAHHAFFTQNVYFPDNRYRYRDLAAKFFYLEHCNDIVNTKKSDLDSFVKTFKHRSDAESILAHVTTNTHSTLSIMQTVFIERDVLLRQVGMITLYYHLCRSIRNKQVDSVTRDMLQELEARRTANRQLAEDTTEHDQEVDTELLEFDKHSQTPNDAYALKIRLRILLNFLATHCHIKHHIPDPL